MADKGKRGESGKRKAASSPFRLNGWPMDWQAQRMGCKSVGSAASGGRTFVTGFFGGVLAEKLGYDMAGNDSYYEVMLAHAERRLDFE